MRRVRSAEERQVQKGRLPGWILMAVLAIVATIIASQAQGLLELALGELKKNPVEKALVAIIIGIALRNFKLLPKMFDAGIKAYQGPLIWGIVLYGVKLDFGKIAEQNPEGLLLKLFGAIVITMAVSFTAIYILARLFRLPQKLSILLGVGTTICGGSAIAITSPLIEAEEQDTSYAVTTIALWGLLAIIVYPLAAQAISGVTDLGFGVFAGTAIHATPQVVGAGHIFSAEAGNIATGVKLIRNCFMVPLAMAVAIWYAHSRSGQADGKEGTKLNWMKAFPWFLFGFFVMAYLGSADYFTPMGAKKLGKAGSFLILMGMGGIGMSTRLDSFKGVGIKPFVVGFIGSLIVAGVSLALIYVLRLY